MFFSEGTEWLNIFSLLLAVSASWYYGGQDFSMHPDRLTASIVSYFEKSIYREGTSREGAAALLLLLATVFGVSELLFYFIKNAGSFWYFVFSLLVFYWIINPRFTRYTPDSNLAVNYMNYAVPVILFSLLFGPVGGLMFRSLQVAAHMNPVTIDKYKVYGSGFEKILSVLTDASLLLVPLVLQCVSFFRKSVRYIKSLLP